MDSPLPSTLALDTSALLALITDGPARTTIANALDHHDIWCASELALGEALPAIDRLTEEEVLRADLEDAFRYVWDWLYTVPVDARCLDDASRIARAAPARFSDAIHMAAATRLPGPTSFATVDAAQFGLAEYCGLLPISP